MNPQPNRPETEQRPDEVEAESSDAKKSYEPPKVESVKLSPEAAEALT